MKEKNIRSNRTIKMKGIEEDKNDNEYEVRLNKERKKIYQCCSKVASRWLSLVIRLN